MKALLLLAQVDPQALDALQRIAVAQMVMAAVMLLIGLIVLGGAIAVFLQARAARRALQRSLEELKPQVAPLVERARDAAIDVTAIADSARRKADDVLHTVENLRRSVERGGAAVEERLRRFNAVLDVVQAETEELMLDAAATAHGLQETARVLRERSEGTGSRSRPSGTGRPVAAEESEEEDQG
jgi:hypothetical protein